MCACAPGGAAPLHCVYLLLDLDICLDDIRSSLSIVLSAPCGCSAILCQSCYIVPVVLMLDKEDPVMVLANAVPLHTAL